MYRTVKLWRKKLGEHSQKGIISRTADNAQENSQTPLESKLESIDE